MIELSEENKIKTNIKSSKGNQYKWQSNGIWYKADLNGYEGLAEFVISSLLEKSSLSKEEFVKYELETIKYKFKTYLGCKSINFLKKGESLITLERLYKSVYGESLSDLLDGIYSAKERLEKIVNFVQQTTGLSNFGEYISKILLIDAIFLNEDRHLHNIALILKPNGKYRLSPIFDNAAGLLSDTNLDYPIEGPIDEMINSVKAKTISDNFDVQLDATESLIGIDMTFCFNEKDVEKILETIDIYDSRIKERVQYILNRQIKKYDYYFMKQKI